MRSGHEIVLQPREFRLLEYLMKNAGQVVTRTMLLEHVWDYHFDPQTNVIDVHVSRLRAKIDKGFDRPLIHTIRGAATWCAKGRRLRASTQAGALAWSASRASCRRSASSSAPRPSSSPSPIS
jgi:two-component system OmpR family response regulator